MNTKEQLIAICSMEGTPEAKVSNRFARCNAFNIYDPKTLEFTAAENNANNEMSGAGAKAAKTVSELGVSILLVPEIGPKAFEALEAFGIEVYKYTNKEQAVRDTVYDFYANKLVKLAAFTKSGKH